MPILCRSYNLLFLMTPRTACSATAKTLCEHLDGEFYPENDVFDSNGMLVLDHKHCTLEKLVSYGYLSEDEVSSLYIVAGIRNPYDSLASLYTKKRTKYKHLLDDKDSWIYKKPRYLEDLKFCLSHSFDEWIEKNYSVGWPKRALGRGRRSLFDRYVNGASAIIRFENLQEDFNKVLKNVGFDEEVNIPKFNDTPSREKNYRKYYSLESKKIVEYTFHKDFRRFNYSF